MRTMRIHRASTGFPRMSWSLWFTQRLYRTTRLCRDYCRLLGKITRLSELFKTMFDFCGLRFVRGIARCCAHCKHGNMFEHCGYELSLCLNGPPPYDRYHNDLYTKNRQWKKHATYESLHIKRLVYVRCQSSRSMRANVFLNCWLASA